LANRDYGKNKCTTHNTIYKELYQLVLDDIRKYAKMAMEQPETLVDMLSTAEEQRLQSSYSIMQSEYEQGKKRLEDLQVLLQKLFEQNVVGILNNANYTAMFTKYQQEQEQLEHRTKELCKKLDSVKESEGSGQKWVDLISKYADLQELDAPIVNELCEKIMVHEAQKVDGIRTQKIEIFYRFVGKLSVRDVAQAS